MVITVYKWSTSELKVCGQSNEVTDEERLNHFQKALKLSLEEIYTIVMHLLTIYCHCIARQQE